MENGDMLVYRVRSALGDKVREAPRGGGQATPLEASESGMSRTVLTIAFAFPPANDSGSARPFHFARNLPDFGYHPVVITQQGFEDYPEDPSLLEKLTGRCDIAHLRPLPFGRFSQKARRLLEWPARVVAAGLRMHLRSPFDLIWATSPPGFALLPAAALSRLTGRPLVVDMRDPWTYGCLWHPTSRLRARVETWLERMVLSQAARIVFTSPLTTETMRRRMGRRIGRRMVTITNGFDAEAPEPIPDAPRDKCVFRHIGRVDRRVRSPEVLLGGLKLACSRPELARDVRLQFIGGLADFRGDLERHGLTEQVEDLGFVSSSASRAYMRGADVLVLLQTIPGLGGDVIAGKAYEYLAARRPVLGVVWQAGGDAWLLRQTGAGLITGLDSPERVAEGFVHYWRLWKQGKLESAVGRADISRFSRRRLTAELAALFDDVLRERQTP